MKTRGLKSKPIKELSDDEIKFICSEIHGGDLKLMATRHKRAIKYNLLFSNIETAKGLKANLTNITRLSKNV